MKKPLSIPFATTAILALADIKTAIEAFDRGESNVFDAVDTIGAALETYRAVAGGERSEAVPRRDAA